MNNAWNLYVIKFGMWLCKRWLSGM